MAKSHEEHDDRRSVRAILDGDDAPKHAKGRAHLAHDDEGEDDEDDDDGEFVRPPRKRKGNVGTIILMLLCTAVLFGAAYLGVKAFVGKNGTPDMAGTLEGAYGWMKGLGGSRPDKDATKTADTELALKKPEVPSTVSVTVKLAAKPIEGEERTVLVARTVETDVQTAGDFPATGIAVNDEARAEGVITVTNNSGKPYTFVATTRFLSKDGVLFRLKKETAIPQSGTVDVAVAADKPGPDGDIQPTTFTIPGLPEATQKVVTGASAAAFTGGSGKSKGVSEDDVALAKDALAAKLRKEASANFAALLGDGEVLNDDLVTATDVKVDAPKPGTATQNFALDLTQRYQAIIIPEKQVLELLVSAIPGVLPEGMDAAEFMLGAPLYTVEAYDDTVGIADVRVDAPLITR